MADRHQHPQHRPITREGRSGPTPAEWRRHKRTICALYEKHSLKEVQAEMESKHDFFATKRMYDIRFRQWGISKILKSSEKQMIIELARSPTGELLTEEAFNNLSQKDLDKVLRWAKAQDRLERERRGVVDGTEAQKRISKANQRPSEEEQDQSGIRINVTTSSDSWTTSPESTAGVDSDSWLKGGFELSRTGSNISSSRLSTQPFTSPTTSGNYTTVEGSLSPPTLFPSLQTPETRDTNFVLRLVRDYYCSRLETLANSAGPAELLAIGRTSQSKAYWSNVKNGNYLYKIARPRAGCGFQDNRWHAFQAINKAHGMAGDALQTEPLDFMLEMLSTLSCNNMCSYNSMGIKDSLRAQVLGWLRIQACEVLFDGHPIALLCNALEKHANDSMMTRAALSMLLKLFTGLLGQSHPSTYRIMSTIITQMRRSDDRDEVESARAFAGNAVNLATADHGPESTEARTAAAELAHVLTKLGDYGSTLSLRMNIVTEKSSHHREEAATTWRQDSLSAHVMEDLAEYYVRHGDRLHGILWLERARTIGTKVWGPQNISTLHVVDKLEKLQLGVLEGQVADGQTVAVA